MNEKISALTDDEVAVEDVAQIITVMQSNRQAAELWSEYHLIGDVMRNAANTSFNQFDSDAMFSADFKHNLMQKLELEPTVLSPNAALANVHQITIDSLHSQHRKMPLTLSIAASFAAVMVVGWMALHQQTQSGQGFAPVEVAQNTAAEQVIPAEYLVAHQVSAPSASSYYIQSVSYSE